MRDPQEGVGRGRWMAFDGPVWIEDMLDEHLLNAFKTCRRFDNPKADELLQEIKSRNLDWRLFVGSRRK